MHHRLGKILVCMIGVTITVLSFLVQPASARKCGRPGSDDERRLAYR